MMMNTRLVIYFYELILLLSFNKSRLSKIKVLHNISCISKILGCGRRRKQHIKYNRYIRVSTVSCHMFIERVQ